MLGGYAGRVLWVNLTQEKTSSKGLDEKTAMKYIGGIGFAAKILWEETTAYTKPFSPENPLIFMIGPLTGTIVPSSSRYVVASISPLTGIWGEAHAGGNWGYELKHTCYDGIVVTGNASKPVYLWITERRAEIVDAGHLWGKDTSETDVLLKKETDSKASVAAIGPAGEKLVRFASIISDGRAGRAAARCGLGAVMGCKRLKAIVVRGSVDPKVHNEKELRKSIRKYSLRVVPWEKKKDSFPEYRRIHEKMGMLPVKNFLQRTFKGFRDKLTEMMLTGKQYYCRGCMVSSCECRMLEERRCPVYQAIVPLGSLCLIDNMKAVTEAYDLCNKYGLDSISTGVVISFAMECFEKGLLTREDTESVDLNWGNHEAMVRMVRKIGEREGFGELLGEGVKRAAEHIGKTAYEYAIHIKGLELPGHDPRAFNCMALEYATSSIGAHHYDAMTIALSPAGRLLHGSQDLGVSELQRVEDPTNRFATKGKGELTAKMQNFMCAIDSLVCCKFLFRAGYFLEWLNLVTGLILTEDELIKTGERIFNLKRLINVRRGISRKDDTLPPRILTHKGRASNLPHLGAMINEYYWHRGWSEEGIPTEEKLTDLGLEEIAKAF